MARELAVWYVMINDEQTGPLTRVELGVELSSGTISGESLVWKGGMVGWLPGAKVPELASLFTNPPKSPRAAGQKPPPLKPPQQKGMGVGEFDTSHFKLADLAAEDTGAQRQMEFDTSHFKLADLKPDDDGQNRSLEFDTSHFRLADLKGNQAGRAAVPKRIAPKGVEETGDEEPVARPASKAPPAAARPPPKPSSAKPPLPASKPPPPVANLPRPQRSLRAESNAPAKPPPSKAHASESLELATPVDLAAKRPAVAARPAPAKAKAAVESDFDPSKTSVDFMAYGAKVQEEAAPDLFVAEAPAPAAVDPTSDAIAKAKAKALSRWAAGEMVQDDSADPKAPIRPPPPIHIPRSGVPVWVFIGGGVLAVLAVVVFLLLRD